MNDIANCLISLEVTPRENGMMLLYTSMRMESGKWIRGRFLINKEEYNWDTLKLLIEKQLDAMKKYRQDLLSKEAGKEEVNNND